VYNFGEVWLNNSGDLIGYFCTHMKQEALLLQRDHTTHLSVEIMQLQNIPFENDCKQQMTFKFIHRVSEKNHSYYWL